MLKRRVQRRQRVASWQHFKRERGGFTEFHPVNSGKSGFVRVAGRRPVGLVIPLTRKRVSWPVLESSLLCKLTTSGGTRNGFSEMHGSSSRVGSRLVLMTSFQLELSATYSPGYSLRVSWKREQTISEGSNHM